MCRICFKEVESVEHIFFRCKWTKEVWKLSSLKLGDLQSVTLLIRWFDKILALDDRSLALGHPPISHSEEGCNVQKWQLPQMGFWKFNCDGAFCPKSKTAAFSIVVRDSEGRLLSTNYGRIRVSLALAAKAWAIRVACSMVKCWGISAIIESDAKRVVQLCLHREGDSCKKVQTIIDDSLLFISGCNAVFSWCKRSANSCANWLACRARKGLLPPPPLSPLLDEFCKLLAADLDSSD
ncbi:hypothetical protein Vadar_012626 [Vaccinium darrowii]|uniref:Uncharacterized protein n=1 Tax=Vaccinium darrowii TaxID=229202 RepID=A0ACB7ZL83_9ERIC|nr:hypothetical protein Vadar_012626 [Vaccinium darrowii]